MFKVLPYLYQRHIFKKALTRFAFILIAIFFLYSLIDYSIHMQDFLDGKKIKFIKLLGFYGCEFIKRAELLIPLSFLVACTHTLLRMNISKELVALLSGGISFRSIMRPLWILAALLCVTQIATQQTLLPVARTYLDNFKYKHIKSVKRSKASSPFYALHLKDGSKVYYLKKDDQKESYYDLIWLKSLDEVWRMKSLVCQDDMLYGNFIDVIKRSPAGIMEKKESYKYLEIKELDLKTASIYKSSVPSENLALSHLVQQLLVKHNPDYSKYEIRTEFFSKLLSSMLSFFALCAIAPFCITYRRQTPTFMLFTLSIFSFLAFKALIDSLKILGINNVLSPEISIGMPYLFLAAYAARAYYKKILC